MIHKNVTKAPILGKIKIINHPFDEHCISKLKKT